MKRCSNLYDTVCDYQNIRLAFLKTLRNKRASAAALVFCRNIDCNLESIRQRLLGSTIRWGEYRSFTITDPKKRIISAAPFEDRIIHHAIMNVLEPVFEKQFVYHTYACRKEKGSHSAVLYAFSKCKTNKYYLKLDIKKYFDSIDHAVLKGQLAHIIKDKKVLTLLSSIIDSYQTTNGKGVPIGNLTSQFFANLYLSSLDHYILEQLKPRGYARYMDDFVLWDSDKNKLIENLNDSKEYINNTLKLELKIAVLDKTENGLPFLGFLIKQKGIYLLQKSKRRIIERVKNIKNELYTNIITEGKAAERVISIHAAVHLARSRSFLKRCWYGCGFGRESRESRRELGQ